MWCSENKRPPPQWFISSTGYSNCHSVANCQCNVPLTAALHTFASPRWPVPKSIFKFRGFETASRWVKGRKKGKIKIKCGTKKYWMRVYGCCQSVCANSIAASCTPMTGLSVHCWKTVFRRHTVAEGIVKTHTWRCVTAVPEEILFSVGLSCTYTRYFCNHLILSVSPYDLYLKQSVDVRHIKAAKRCFSVSAHIKSTCFLLEHIHSGPVLPMPGEHLGLIHFWGSCVFQPVYWTPRPKVCVPLLRRWRRVSRQTWAVWGYLSLPWASPPSKPPVQ